MPASPDKISDWGGGGGGRRVSAGPSFPRGAVFFCCFFFRSRILWRTEKKLVSKGRKIRLQRKEDETWGGGKIK